jgi:hypothetical protein
MESLFVVEALFFLRGLVVVVRAIFVVVVVVVVGETTEITVVVVVCCWTKNALIPIYSPARVHCDSQSLSSTLS